MVNMKVKEDMEAREDREAKEDREAREDREAKEGMEVMTDMAQKIILTGEERMKKEKGEELIKIIENCYLYMLTQGCLICSFLKRYFKKYIVSDFEYNYFKQVFS